MSFAENLKEAMFCKNMKAKDLAAKTGLGYDTINSYLKTDGSIPTADKAVAMAEELDVSVEFLVNGFQSEGQPDDSVVKEHVEKINDIEKDLSGLTPEDLSTVEIIVKALKNRK